MVLRKIPLFLCSFSVIFTIHLLENNNIGNIGAISLSRLISYNDSLEILDLGNNKIINKKRVGWNKIKDEGIISLAYSLEKNKGLSSITLSNATFVIIKHRRKPVWRISI